MPLSRVARISKMRFPRGLQTQRGKSGVIRNVNSLTKSVRENYVRVDSEKR